MTVKPKYYFNLDGNITDGEKEYSLYNIKDVVGGLSISSGLKERYVLYGRNSLLDLLNELYEKDRDGEECYRKLLEKYDTLKEENEELKKQLNAFKPIIFEDTNNGGSSILYEKVEE